MKNLIIMFGFAFSVAITTAQASELTIPNQFSSGTKAVAADVNANFDASAIAVNDNQAQINALLAQVTALVASVEALELANTEMQAVIDSLESNSIEGLSSILSVAEDNQGNTTAIFSGTNVHVNNGSGNSNIVNGLGNLIVGYDEARDIDSLDYFCADGSFNNQPDCEASGEVWSNNHKSGSHNLVIGPLNNYSRTGGLIAGTQNTINGISATVSGGLKNVASYYYASVSGGYKNTASGNGSSVSGGENNTASNLSSSVSAGNGNTASGTYSSVSGGANNTASNVSSSVSAGNGNTASGTYSSVSGGAENIASGINTSVSAGYSNTASVNSASVSGGEYNTSSGMSASVSGGGNNTAFGTRTSVSGGFQRSATGTDTWSAGSLTESN